MHNDQEGKIFIPSEEYYKSEEYLKSQEQAFNAQKYEFRNFLPVEFFHWVGMEGSGERGILDVILEDHPEFINLHNRNSETALMVAARLNLVDNIKVLLGCPNVDISYSNENGNFVMYAVAYRSNNVLNYILDYHRDKIDFDCRTSIGDSIFHLAARQANIRLWEEITPEQSSKYAYIENSAGNNCLALAVESYFQYRNHIALEEVLKHFKKPDLYKPNRFGKTILDRIKEKEKELILRKKSTKFLGPMKFLLGIEA